MKLVRNRIIIISLFVALVNLFALGCFFTSQDFHNNHDRAMSSMECCGIGSLNSNDHAGYNLQYNLIDNTYQALNLIVFSFLIIILYLKEIELSGYYLAKDRYGGFKLFYKFLLLFKLGILHPKIY